MAEILDSERAKKGIEMRSNAIGAEFEDVMATIKHVRRALLHSLIGQPVAAGCKRVAMLPVALVRIRIPVAAAHAPPRATPVGQSRTIRVWLGCQRL
jgi:hypothetical protein